MSKIEELKSLLGVIQEVGMAVPETINQVNALLATGDVGESINLALTTENPDDAQKAIDLVEARIEKYKRLNYEVRVYRNLMQEGDHESIAQYRTRVTSWSDSHLAQRALGPRLRERKDRAVVDSLPADTPSIDDLPDIRDFAKGMGYDEAGMRDKAKEIAEQYYQLYKNQIISHFSALSAELGIEFAEVAEPTGRNALGTFRMGVGTNGKDVIELSTRKILAEHLAQTGTNSRVRLIAWSDGSTSYGRDYSIFPTSTSKMKNVFAHEVAHADVTPTYDPKMTHAQSEVITRSQEPRVMRTLYGDTAGIDYEKDPVTYPFDAPMSLRDRAIQSFKERFNLIGKAYSTVKGFFQSRFAPLPPAVDPYQTSRAWEKERKRERTSVDASTEVRGRASESSNRFVGDTRTVRTGRRTAVQAVPLTPEELQRVLNQVSFVAFDPSIPSPEETRMSSQQQKVLARAAERWAKSILANPKSKTSEQIESANAIMAQVSKHQALTSAGVANDSPEILDIDRTLTEMFKKASPDEYTAKLNIGSTSESRAELRNLFTSLFTLLSDVGLEDPVVRAAAEKESTQSDIMAGLARVFRYIGIDDPTRGYETVLAGRLVSSSPDLLRQILKLPPQNLKRLFSAAVGRPRDYNDVLPPTAAIEVGSGADTSIFEYIFEDPDEDKRDYQIASEFFSRRGLGVQAFVQSIRTAFKEGSQVVAGQPSQVFGQGPGFVIEQELDKLYQQVLKDIAESKTVEVSRADGSTVSVPATLADPKMLVQIRQAIARSSQYTTLLGSLGTKVKGVPSSLAIDGQQLMINLGAAMLLDNILKGGELVNPAERVRESIIEPKEVAGKGFDGPLVERVPTTNMIDMQFDILRESMEFQKERALEAFVAEENPELVELRRREYEQKIKNIKFLETLLDDQTTPEQRIQMLDPKNYKRLTELESRRTLSPEEKAEKERLTKQLRARPLTKQTLGLLLFGAAPFAVPDFPNAAEPIREQASALAQSTALQSILPVGSSYQSYSPLALALRYMEDKDFKGLTRMAIASPMTGQDGETGVSAQTQGELETRILETLEQSFGISGFSGKASMLGAVHFGNLAYSQEEDRPRTLEEMTSLTALPAGLVYGSLIDVSEQMSLMAQEGVPLVNYAKKKVRQRALAAEQKRIKAEAVVQKRDIDQKIKELEAIKDRTEEQQKELAVLRGTVVQDDLPLDFRLELQNLDASLSVTEGYFPELSSLTRDQVSTLAGIKSTQELDTAEGGPTALSEVLGVISTAMKQKLSAILGTLLKQAGYTTSLALDAVDKFKRTGVVPKGFEAVANVNATIDAILNSDGTVQNAFKAMTEIRKNGVSRAEAIAKFAGTEQRLQEAGQISEEAAVTDDTHYSFNALVDQYTRNQVGVPSLMGMYDSGMMDPSDPNYMERLRYLGIEKGDQAALYQYITMEAAKSLTGSYDIPAEYGRKGSTLQERLATFITFRALQRRRQHNKDRGIPDDAAVNQYLDTVIASYQNLFEVRRRNMTDDEASYNRLAVLEQTQKRRELTPEEQREQRILKQKTDQSYSALFGQSARELNGFTALSFREADVILPRTAEGILGTDLEFILQKHQRETGASTTRTGSSVRQGDPTTAFRVESPLEDSYVSSVISDNSLLDQMVSLAGDVNPADIAAYRKFRSSDSEDLFEDFSGTKGVRVTTKDVDLEGAAQAAELYQVLQSVDEAVSNLTPEQRIVYESTLEAVRKAQGIEEGAQEQLSAGLKLKDSNARRELTEIESIKRAKDQNNAKIAELLQEQELYQREIEKELAFAKSPEFESFTDEERRAYRTERAKRFEKMFGMNFFQTRLAYKSAKDGVQEYRGRNLDLERQYPTARLDEREQKLRAEIDMYGLTTVAKLRELTPEESKRLESYRSAGFVNPVEQAEQILTAAQQIQQITPYAPDSPQALARQRAAAEKEYTGISTGFVREQVVDESPLPQLYRLVEQTLIQLNTGEMAGEIFTPGNLKGLENATFRVIESLVARQTELNDFELPQSTGAFARLIQRVAKDIPEIAAARDYTVSPELVQKSRQAIQRLEGKEGLTAAQQQELEAARRVMERYADQEESVQIQRYDGNKGVTDLLKLAANIMPSPDDVRPESQLRRQQALVISKFVDIAPEWMLRSLQQTDISTSDGVKKLFRLLSMSNRNTGQRYIPDPVGEAIKTVFEDPAFAKYLRFESGVDRATEADSIVTNVDELVDSLMMTKGMSTVSKYDPAAVEKRTIVESAQLRAQAYRGYARPMTSARRRKMNRTAQQSTATQLTPEQELQDAVDRAELRRIKILKALKRKAVQTRNKQAAEARALYYSGKADPAEYAKRLKEIEDLEANPSARNQGLITYLKEDLQAAQAGLGEHWRRDKVRKRQTELEEKRLNVAPLSEEEQLELERYNLIYGRDFRPFTPTDERYSATDNAFTRANEDIMAEARAIAPWQKQLTEAYRKRDTPILTKRFAPLFYTDPEYYEAALQEERDTGVTPFNLQRLRTLVDKVQQAPGAQYELIRQAIDESFYHPDRLMNASVDPSVLAQIQEDSLKFADLPIDDKQIAEAEATIAQIMTNVDRVRAAMQTQQGRAQYRLERANEEQDARIKAHQAAKSEDVPLYRSSSEPMTDMSDLPEDLDLNDPVVQALINELQELEAERLRLAAINASVLASAPAVTPAAAASAVVTATSAVPVATSVTTPTTPKTNKLFFDFETSKPGKEGEQPVPLQLATIATDPTVAGYLGTVPGKSATFFGTDDGKVNADIESAVKQAISKDPSLATKDVVAIIEARLAALLPDKFGPAAASQHTINPAVLEAMAGHLMAGGELVNITALMDNAIKQQAKQGNMPEVIGQNIKEFDLPLAGGGWAATGDLRKEFSDKYAKGRGVNVSDLLEAYRSKVAGSGKLGDIYQAVFGKPLVDAHLADADTRATQELYEAFGGDASFSKLDDFAKQYHQRVTNSRTARLLTNTTAEQAQQALRFFAPLRQMERFVGAASLDGGKLSVKSESGHDITSSFENLLKHFVADPSAPMTQADLDLIKSKMQTMYLDKYQDYGVEGKFAPVYAFLRRRALQGTNGDAWGSYQASMNNFGSLDDMLTNPNLLIAMLDAQKRAAARVSASAGGGGGLGTGGGNGSGAGPTGPGGLPADNVHINATNVYVNGKVSSSADADSPSDSSSPVGIFEKIMQTRASSKSSVRTGKRDYTIEPSLIESMVDEEGAIIADPSNSEASVDPSGLITIPKGVITTLTADVVSINTGGGAVNLTASLSPAAAGALQRSMINVFQKAPETPGAKSAQINLSGMTGFSGGSNYGSPEDLIVRSVVNRLALQRTSVIDQLSKEKDATARTQIQSKAMEDFAKIATDALRSSIGDAGLPELGDPKGLLEEFRIDPQSSLEKYSSLVEQKYISSQKEFEDLVAKTDLTDEEKQRLDELTASNASLARFVGLIKELRTQLEYTTKAVNQTREPYERAPAGSSSAASRSRVSPDLPASQRTRYEQMSLQAYRHQYEQSLGFMGTRSAVENRNELVRRTADYTRNTARAIGIDSLTNPLPGLENQSEALRQALAQLQAPAQGIEDFAGRLEQMTQAMQDFTSAADALYQQTADGPEKQAIGAQLGIAREGFYAFEQGLKEARATEGILTSTRRQQLATLREQLQSNATQNYMLGAFSPLREFRRRRTLESFFAENFTTEAASRVLYRDGMVTARSAENPDRSVDIRYATPADLQATAAFLQTQGEGSDVSVESLQNLQRIVNEEAEQRNQSPYSRVFNNAMNAVRDLQTGFDVLQSVFNFPQTLVSTIQQFAEPQLNAVRTLTTARALSLGSEKYNQVLGAASNLRERFGGTVTGQLGQITSFIPLTNAYGVELDQTVNVARKLAAFDPAQGMEGASIAIKEFLSGNVSSLSRRFEINRSELSRINTGSPEEMLNSLNELLNTMGITDRLIDEQANSMATRYDKMVGNLEQIFINLSATAVDTMTPTLEALLMEGGDGLNIPMLGNVNLSQFARDRSFEVMLGESALGAADEVLTGPNGLDSINIDSTVTEFVSSVDEVLNRANMSMGKMSSQFAQDVGVTAQFDTFRNLGNMGRGERMYVQALARQNVGAGMTTSQAILQAMREVGGDFNMGQANLGFRRELGFYNDIALSDAQQKDLVQSLAAGNTDGWNNLASQVRVLEVTDADTILVEDVQTGAQELVRFMGIDAYESGTPEGDAATEYMKQFEGQIVDLQRGELDVYNRRLGMVSANGVNLNADLLRQGYAVSAFTEGLPEQIANQMQLIGLSAANAGVGPVNSLAAQAGLGAAPIISEAAREQVYQERYGLWNRGWGALAGILGGMGASAGANSAWANGRVFGPMIERMGGANPSLWRSGAANLTSGIAKTGVSIIGSAITAAIVGGVVDLQNRRAYAEDNSYEVIRAQMEAQGRIDSDELVVQRTRRLAEAIAERAPLSQEAQAMQDSIAYLDKQATLISSTVDMGDLTAEQVRAMGIGEEFVDRVVEGRSSRLDAAASARRMAYGEGGIPGAQQTIDEFRTGVAQNLIGMLQPAVVRANELYQTAYGQMSDNEKAVQAFTKVNPLTGDTESIANIRKSLDVAYMNTENPAVQRTLQDNEDKISEFESYAAFLTENADTFASALGETVTIIRDSNRIAGLSPFVQGSQQEQKITLTRDVIKSMNYSELQSVLSALATKSVSTYNQEAKNYSDQTMEKMMQLRQSRFNTMMDMGASLAFTPGGASLTSAALTGRGGIPDSRLEAMFPVTGIDDPKIVANIKNAMRQAEEAYIATAEAFTEQSQLTYAFNLSYGSTMRNFLATVMDPRDTAGTNFNTVMANMGQGNPRFVFDFFDQMTGINPMQMMQQGILPNATLRSAGPGAVSFGYTQGPRGQVKQFTDILRSELASSSFNLQDIYANLSGLGQANSQIIMQGVQFNNQMRDLTINHNRTLEDIARNNGRQLESIHRNFAREMLVNQQTNEVNKRSTVAGSYENLINASAKISPEETARLNQEYVNNRNEANRLGVFNYELFMEQGKEEDPVLAGLVEEYKTIDPTDYAAREAFFQDKLRPRVAEVLPMLEQRYATAEGPEKERYGRLITALTPDPQRADKFLADADTKLNEGIRRATVKAENERELKRLKLSEEGIRNQISDQEKTIREKGATMTPEELRDAQLNLRVLQGNLEDNLNAQKAAEAAITGVTATLPLYGDSVKETWNSIVRDSTTALSQLRTNLTEFSITAQQQIEDAQLNLDRSKADVIRQFNDAAVEIAQTVPVEFAGMLDAILNYNSARTAAQLMYDGASQLTGGEKARRQFEAQEMMRKAGVDLGTNLGLSPDQIASLTSSAVAGLPIGSDVVKGTDSTTPPAAVNLGAALSKYAYKGTNALQVVIVKEDKTYLDQPKPVTPKIRGTNTSPNQVPDGGVVEDKPIP